MRKGRLNLTLVTVSLLVVSSVAYAGTVSVGAGAFSGTPVITFESLSNGDAITNQFAADGVTFTNLWANTEYGTTYFADAGLVGAANFTDAGCCVIPAVMNFSTPYTLVGFEIVSNGDTEFDLTGADGSIDVFHFNARPSSSSGIFVGFQNAAGISSVSIGPAAVNNALLLDNIQLEGQGSGTVPEPTSWLLFGSGLAMVLRGRLRRFKA